MDATIDHDAAVAPAKAPAPRFIYKHRLATRLWHWINVVAIFIMIGSGLGILNAHPHLYWGQYGANPDPAWLHLPHWPGWMTIPGHYNLALSRRWHLAFALILAFNLLIFMIASLLNRHFQRDLAIRRDEITPAHLWHDIKEHAALRFHDAAHPGAFNILQKIAYASALFVFIPTIILTGLAMSPGMDAAWPWLIDLFGGRASARSIHFIAMLAIIGFIIVHLALVILAGAWDEVSSMITGRWRVPEEH
jgi:Ni/Fe-hydrogenase b-type cytochrome subunit